MRTPSMRRSPRLSRLACAAAAAGALALPVSAFGAEAWMTETYGGGVGNVEYRRGGEANDVRITRESSTSITVEDWGRYIWSAWGWGASYGCETASVSDFDGTYPATCSHPNRIWWVTADLGGGDDRLRLGTSIGNTTIRSGGGDDQVDVRDGKGGKDTIHCGPGVDWALVDEGDRSYDCETHPLGGILTSGAAAASRTPGTLDVYARGADGNIWTRTWTGSFWTDWAPLPGNGRVAGAPAVVAGRLGPGTLEVFARGYDNQVWQTWHDGNGWVGRWQPLGGQLSSDPAVVSWGQGRLDLFVRWDDGTLRQRYWDASWPNGTGWVNLGGQLTSKPAAASQGHGRVDVFVRGTDDALYQRAFDGSGWSDWQHRGGGLTSAPAAASRANGTLDVIARGAWNELFQIKFEAGRWGGWRSIGGDVAGVRSDPTLVGWGSGRLDAFVRVSDDSIYQLMLP